MLKIPKTWNCMNAYVILLLSEEYEMVGIQKLPKGNYSNSFYFFIRTFQSESSK